MISTLLLLAVAAPVAASAHAADQNGDQTRAYISAGFATMDSNKDGKIDRAEFDRFMRARLARQAAQFDGTFKQLDANGDNRISQSEAATGNALLAQHFAEVDTNHDGSVSKEELRAALVAAQAQEAGLN